MADPITIRASTQSLRDSPAIQSLLHFKENVESASNLELRVEIFHSGKRYRDDQVGPAVSAGQVEMGYINLSRYAAVIPAADLFQQPFLFNTDVIGAAARAPESEIRQLIDDAILEKAHSRVLWWSSQGQTVFLSNGDSVANPERIAGKTVRTFGPTIEAVIKGCGGTPKDIGGSEQAAAYEKRDVDIGMAGVSTVVGRKLWRSLDTITRTNHASVEFVVAVNETFWRTLSEKHQAILKAAAAKADAEAAKTIRDIEATAYQDLAKANSAKIINLSEGDLMLWRICSSDILSDVVEKSGELGQQLILAYGRLRKQPCCSQAANGSATPNGIEGAR